MIRLAPATATDVDDFAALATAMDVLRRRAARPAPAMGRGDQAALFGVSPAAFALLARDDTDELVGFAAYSFLWPAAGLSASLYLKELYVAGSARRTGVATALMRGPCGDIRGRSAIGALVGTLKRTRDGSSK